MIILRKANYSDLSLLKYWDEQEHVIASYPYDDWNWTYELQREPDWREQLIAEIEARTIPFVIAAEQQPYLSHGPTHGK